ncbi:MAG: starch-binding protein, partial [Dysgonamonadaceae bacterium]|nr:starch-binding protein [Dysgonamonadaceae bacterium]
MKKINFFALLTLCALVLSATNTFAFTVKWKASAGSPSGVYAYAWNINNEAEHYFGDWPGKPVTAGTDGWYSVTIPDGATAGVVVNNGGNGKQCGNMAPLSADACYLVNFNDWSFTTANCSSGQGEDTPAFYIKWKIVAGADLWNAMFIYA